MTDIHRLSAVELAAAIRRGTITSRAALETFITRSQSIDSAIGAIVARRFDEARAEADAADAAVAEGWPLGPLHGVPITIKDTWELSGLPTVVGDPDLRDYQSKHTAVAIERLRAAGAVVFAKTNTPRMAQDVQTFNSVFGTTVNPWDPDRTPGGSSGGAAAAVAAGLTAFEIGSDLAGSIRIPASWCGVYGHKSSYGLVPMRGHIPGPPGMQSTPDVCVAGPIARRAHDLAPLLDVLAGPAGPDAACWRTNLPPPRATTLADYRVGVFFDTAYCAIDDAVRTVLDNYVEHARAGGATIEVMNDLPGGATTNYQTFDQLLSAIIGAALPARLYKRAARGAPLAGLMRSAEAGTFAGFLKGSQVSYRDWTRINEARARLREAWHEAFDTFDVVLAPVTPVPPIAHDQKSNPYKRRIRVNGQPRPYTDLFRWIGPAGVASLPATSAPAGQTHDNLPVGIQILADYGHDKTAIAFAEHVAAILGEPPAPPDFAADQR